MSTANPFPSLNPWQESKSKLKYDGTKSNGLYKWIIVSTFTGQGQWPLKPHRTREKQRMKVEGHMKEVKQEKIEKEE